MIGFPLLLVPFAIYNMIAFLTPIDWALKLYSLPLRSGVIWEPTASDAFLAVSLLMLMIEFIKSNRQGKSFVEHFLSLCLAGGAAAEFWMVREAGNSTFLLLVVICFVDLFAGFAASIRRARRAVVVEQTVPVVVEPAPAPARVETVRVEPARAETVRVEPAPANPFTTAPPAPPAPPGPPMPRAEPPVVKIEPVQKAES